MELWHWRWNAHILVARGYAVLGPDPAISLGYGQAMIQRGWVDWGAAPFTDVMTAVDGALERPDIDASRTALTGGSFGGYMANWVAGHTDRFKAIVTHASLWELRGFHGTTDTGAIWEHEMGDPYRDPTRYIRESPSQHIAAITTPMLVIHGEQDFRVPVSEALRLWTDLRRHGVSAKFLYFPDENHWILKPANARLWYATVLAFLDEHVLGKPFERPRCSVFRRGYRWTGDDAPAGPAPPPSPATSAPAPALPAVPASAPAAPAQAPRRPSRGAKIMRSFFRDGRLVSIPAHEQKKLVVLRHIVDLCFPEDRAYPEKEVNQRLALLHPDVAALRRYLVDYGLMTRAAGEYRRT